MEEEVVKFEFKIKSATEPLQLAYQEWRLVYNKVKQEVEDTKKELADAGTVVEGLEHIPQTLLGIASELAVIEKQTQEIKLLENKRITAVEELRQIWRAETEIRIKKASSLMLAMQPDATKKPSVGIVVTHQSDEESLVQVISAHITHRGKLNEEDIRGILDCCRTATRNTPNDTLLDVFISETRKHENSSCLSNLSSTRRSNFLERFNESTLRQLEVTRVKDQVCYYAYRPDGTFAGEVDKVSAGQQGTAILNLMLSDGTIMVP